MEKETIGSGHWIFAGIFAIAFIASMVYAYRKDLRGIKFQYRNVWTVLVLILVIYFGIYFLVKWI